MKNKFLLLTALTLTVSALLQLFLSVPIARAALPSTGLEDKMVSDIVVHNRILAKVNGKMISVLDLMKKMDLIFYRKYPDLTSSLVARYQFYMNSWPTVLADMIDDELMIADAVEKKVEISDGDVREELESLFGPNVVLNIDKIGLTFEEAWEMLKKEITVRRMTMFMVRSKASNQAHPKKVRQLYEDFAKQNQVEHEWRYRVLTIRSEDSEKSDRIAKLAYKLLDEEKVPFGKIADILSEKGELGEEVAINLSEEYQRKDKELALAHRAILQTLNIGSHSSPILQTSKSGSYTVNRIFFLTEKVGGKAVSFKEMEEQFRKELTQQAIEKEQESYLKKLRRRYGVTDQYLREMIPNKFAPFSLQ